MISWIPFAETRNNWNTQFQLMICWKVFTVCSEANKFALFSAILNFFSSSGFILHPNVASNGWHTTTDCFFYIFDFRIVLNMYVSSWELCLCALMFLRSLGPNCLQLVFLFYLITTLFSIDPLSHTLLSANSHFIKFSGMKRSHRIQCSDWELLVV